MTTGHSGSRPAGDRASDGSGGAGPHPADLLVGLVAGQLNAAEAAGVERHVRACAECRLELEAWQGVAEATRARAGAVPPPSPSLLPTIAERIAREAGPARNAPRAWPRARPAGRRLAWLRSFVPAQVPLVRREIWPASAVVMAIGAAISLLDSRGSAPGAALALFAPFAAAVGIALIYGQDNDPGLELAVATPTSPRLVVVARLVVVVAWDLALALAATVLLAVIDGPAVFVPLVSLWLGPMLLLGCLALLLSLFVGSSLAIGVAAVIWALRAIQLSGDADLQRLSSLPAVLDGIWQTTPLTLTAAAAFLVLALAVAPLGDDFVPRAAQ